MDDDKEPEINEENFDKKFRNYSRLAAARWRNRRKMAWMALVAIFVVTYWAMFKVTPERLDKLDDIITWFYITMASIIGAYVGFATLDDKWKKK